MKGGHDIRVVHGGGDLIGECPVWNVDEQALYWVDTRRPSVQRADREGQVRTWLLPFGIGSFAFRERGGLIAGMERGFCTIDLETGAVTLVADPEPGRNDTRLNDGRCDPRGRFWCGSRDEAGASPKGALYRLDPDFSCHRMDEGFIISNGMAFSPKAPVMIFGDSTGETIYRYDFDAETGSISNRAVYLDTRHLPWRVDGAAFDDEGYYWCALVRDWSIGRFDSAGRLDRLIRLPVRLPTMCAFGGPDLDVLYVTSSRLLLDDEERPGQPLAGSLFAIHGLGVRGLPPARFAG